MKAHSSVPLTKHLPPAAGIASTCVFLFLLSREPSWVPARLLYCAAEVCSLFYLENFKGAQVYFPTRRVTARAGYRHRQVRCAGTGRFTHGPQHRNTGPWEQGKNAPFSRAREERPSPSGAQLGGTDGAHPGTSPGSSAANFFGGCVWEGKGLWGWERRVQLVALALWQWDVTQVSIAPASITRGQGEGKK